MSQLLNRLKKLERASSSDEPDLLDEIWLIPMDSSRKGDHPGGDPILYWRNPALTPAAGAEGDRG